MDTAKTKPVDRSAHRTGVRMSQEALYEDISRASEGDPKAAARILTELAGEDRRAQARAALAIVNMGNEPLWYNLIEFACIGKWVGQEVAVNVPEARRTLQPKVVALFLTRQNLPSAKERLEALTRALTSREAGVRRFAAELLREWDGSIDSGPLVSLINDPDVSVRLRAARALGKKGDASAVQPLIEALRQDDDLIAGEAADALAAIGGPAVDPLIKALHDNDSHVRWRAAKALSEMANPRTVDSLLDALDDQNFGVRWNAARGLAAIGRQAVVPLLRTLRVKAVTPWLAEGAIHVLKNVKDPDLIILVEELEKRLWDTYAYIDVPIEADRVLRKLEEERQHEARRI